MEHDFVVAPGADPGVIRLAFDGVVEAGLKSAPTIDDHGDLILHTAGDEIRLHKPRIYQEINGVKQPIPGGYILLKPRTSNLEPQQVSFQVAAYDTTKPLIIDPTLSYSTYLGGSGDEYAVGIAVDSSGNAYVTGQTNSANFPTASPLQAAYGGGHDAFVTKLNAAGSALVYSTYLGSNGRDSGHNVTVDASGNAYVAGTTESTNFPTASPLQAAHGGGTRDAFVAKLNAAGSALTYSTYLGGSGSDEGVGITIDSSGTTYVTGETASTNFPTASPLQAAYGGGTLDAFVAKLNATGSALTYSTYLGGSGDEKGFSIAVDSSGNTYLAGRTTSTNFPTASPLQAAYGGGHDVFAAKINAAGSALVYSTYLGGSSSDTGFTSAVDSSGNVYVTGRTASANFPTASPFQANFAGGTYDVFVAKIADTTCTYSISPTSQTFSASGGTGSVSVSTSSGCSWTAVSNDSWITITSGSSGTGSGTVNYSVAANTGTSSRTGTMTIAGQTFTVTQSPPDPVLSVSPTSLDFGSVTVGSCKDLTFTVTNSGGGTLTGSVTTSSPYSIVSGSSFSLTAGASQTVTVRFCPTSCGTFLGNVSVSSNGGSASVTLSGTGTGTYSISPTSQTFSASGGTGSVSVTADSGCSWTAASNASWITITSGSTGSGSGTVSYTVEAYTGTSSRTGTITIAGQTFTVTQDGVSCTYSISPTSQSFGASGGAGSVSVTAGSGCSWTAVSNASWITITSGSSGSGNGTVSYSVAANSDASQRTGTLTIAGQTFTVTQDGVSCTYSISPTSQSFGSSGGTGSVSVSTSSSCSWTATSNASWIIITSGSSGTGSGTVSYTVAANTGTSPRTGTLTIAGQTFTVIQEECFYSIFPTSQSFGANGGTESVSVSTSSGCSWTAVSNVSWTAITSGSSGSGNGTVSYTVEANTSSSSRTGTLTIAGQTFTVIQGGSDPELYVTPTSLDFGIVQVGSSKNLTFSVQNIGGGTLIGTVSTSAVDFSIVSESSFTLTAEATQEVKVRFSPSKEGTFSGTVIVSSNGGGAEVRVTGVGKEVCEPILTVTPSTLNFGMVRVGKSKDLSFEVQNTAECDSTLAGTATATDPFSVVANSSFTLDAGELLLVTVRFSPPTKGPFTGTVEFASNGGDFTATVTGKGRGKLLPFREDALSVAIDIEPGREDNSLDCQSTEEIAVGIMDVLGLPSPIEVSTLELEGAIAQSWVAGDVDEDGEKDDLVVSFGIEGVDAEACEEGITSFFLVGKLEDGRPIEGSNEVNIVRGR